MTNELMSPKENRVFAAVAKMQAGKMMYDEGRAELKKLLGEAGIEKFTGEKAAAAGEKTKRVVAHRMVRRRRRPNVDKAVLDKVYNGIRAAKGWATVYGLAETTKLSSYTIERALETLKRSKDKRIEAQWKKGNPSHEDPRVKGRLYRYWQTA